jgi:hypothetical protein
MAQLSISKEVCIGSFLQLSDAAKACYFVLLLFADRAGLCDKRFILKVNGDHAEDALSELSANGFILELDETIAIRHWLLHDTNNRKSNATMFAETRNKLTLKDSIYELNDTTKRSAKK